MTPEGVITPRAEVRVSSGSGQPDRDANLRLTQFLDLATLQDIQDSLVMVAQVKASIQDAAGTALTQTTVSERFSTRSAAIAAARKQKGDAELDQPFSAPIEVAGQRIGTIVMEPSKPAPIKTSQ